MIRSWIVVASADHVRNGCALGFMQAGHGKLAPLRRLRAGDRVVGYSPTEAFRGGGRLQSFTAIGIIEPAEPYQVDMGGGFSPFRRDVSWLEAQEAPIVPLLEMLVSRPESGIGDTSCASGCSRSATTICA